MVVAVLVISLVIVVVVVVVGTFLRHSLFVGQSNWSAQIFLDKLIKSERLDTVLYKYRF